MNIELKQTPMSVHIKIMGDESDWRSEIAVAYKRWEHTREAGPLFSEKIIYRAMARFRGGNQDGQASLEVILKLNIYNAIAAHLAWQLDELFKTTDDFRRKVEVVQDGVEFLVRWKVVEDSGNA